MNFRKGQSIAEILVALGLFVVGIGSVTILIFGGQGIVEDRDDAIYAQSLVKEGVEGATSILKGDWTGAADGTYGLTFSNASGTWQFSGGQDAQNGFTRQITVTTIDANQKKVKSSVAWQAAPGRSLSGELITLVTNWQEAVLCPTDGYGSGVSGNWASPQTLGSIDLGAGNEGTGIDARKKMVYISAKASTASKADIFIVDATDGANPEVLSSLNTGPGLNAIDVEGRYAYVVSRDDEDHLQIIDICNKTNPTLVSTYELPGGADRGLSIFYANNKVYIGTDDDSAPEFYIVDVTNRSSPSLLGSLEIGDDVNGIYVAGNTAYLATPLDSELVAVDVSNPANPSIVGSYDAPGNSENGLSVFGVGNRLYLGRAWGAKHTNHHELHVLDITATSSPNNLGSKDVPTDVLDFVVQDHLAFLGTNDSNKELQIFDISNPANITPVATMNFPNYVTALDYEDNVVYASVRSNDAVRIIVPGP